MTTPCGIGLRMALPLVGITFDSDHREDNVELLTAQSAGRPALRRT
jgi:hypothetical protein